MNAELLNTVKARNLLRITATEPQGEYAALLTQPKDFVLTTDDKKVIDDYFQQFIHPKHGCPVCGPGVHIEWLLTHGEAACVTCRYPFRVYHRNVGTIKHLKYPLAYHPEDLVYEPNR